MNHTASQTAVSPTISPFTPPTPTQTSSEDDMTKPPIVINNKDDNENDDLVYLIVCDEDIVLLNQVCTTNIVLHKDEAICIINISQDCATVAVQLHQTWYSANLS